ncbi:hypothetical protein A2U01_0046281, partial [Trifolium medium]|nr:hypothetical protein [Trifolium medium]
MEGGVGLASRGGVAVPSVVRPKLAVA